MRMMDKNQDSGTDRSPSATGVFQTEVMLKKEKKPKQYTGEPDIIVNLSNINQNIKSLKEMLTTNDNNKQL